MFLFSEGTKVTPAKLFNTDLKILESQHQVTTAIAYDSTTQTFTSQEIADGVDDDIEEDRILPLPAASVNVFSFSTGGVIPSNSNIFTSQRSVPAVRIRFSCNSNHPITLSLAYKDLSPPRSGEFAVQANDSIKEFTYTSVGNSNTVTIDKVFYNVPRQRHFWIYLKSINNLTNTSVDLSATSMRLDGSSELDKNRVLKLSPINISEVISSSVFNGGTLFRILDDIPSLKLFFSFVAKLSGGGVPSGLKAKLRWKDGAVAPTTITDETSGTDFTPTAVTGLISISPVAITNVPAAGRYYWITLDKSGVMSSIRFKINGISAAASGSNTSGKTIDTSGKDQAMFVIFTNDGTTGSTHKKIEFRHKSATDLLLIKDNVLNANAAAVGKEAEEAIISAMRNAPVDNFLDLTALGKRIG